MDQQDAGAGLAVGCGIDIHRRLAIHDVHLPPITRPWDHFGPHLRAAGGQLHRLDRRVAGADGLLPVGGLPGRFSPGRIIRGYHSPQMEGDKRVSNGALAVVALLRGPVLGGVLGVRPVALCQS